MARTNAPPNGREFAQLGAPRIEPAGLDVGLADVIEDERHVGTLPHEENRVRKLAVENAEVETQSV